MEPKNRIVIDLVAGGPEDGKKPGKECDCDCQVCKCGKKNGKGYSAPLPELRLISYEEEAKGLFSIVRGMDERILSLQRSRRWPGSGRGFKKH
ncbi:MAG: hypothetical protein HY956_02170 [Deltaproteobacteria bacterium]|nr:hypothetical protein [Deltaproteobacteria bacterium]